MKNRNIALIIMLVLSLITIVAMAQNTEAKSVYTISAINGNPTPVEAYDIQADGSLIFQAEYAVPYYGWGAVGIAIDTDSKTLFITYEQSNVIQLLNAETMTDLGTTIAPNSNNLAGIIMDQDKSLLYIVDRGTSNLYIYKWYPSNSTLNLQSVQTLTDNPYSFGIALDEIHDILYVPSYLDQKVFYYDTDTWAKIGEYNVSYYPQSVAVDGNKQYVYTGGGTGSSTLLSKYEIIAGIETTIDMGEYVMGLGVDPATSYVYGNIGYGIGINSFIQVFDSDLNKLSNVSFNYSYPSPTGLCIPGKDISYNPLNLTKYDGLDDGCVSPGNNIDYTIYFDNELNDFNVTNLIINDTLPVEVDFISASNGGIYHAGTHTVQWNIGTINAYQTEQQISLTVQVKSGTTNNTIITNYVMIKSDQTPPTTRTEETIVCEEDPDDDDTPPVQTVEFGEKKIIMEWYGENYTTISCTTPIWINSTDPGGVGSKNITYSLWKENNPVPGQGEFIDPILLYTKTVEDQSAEDTNPTYGIVSVMFTIDESCFHELHYRCEDYNRNTDGHRDVDFIVDCCGPNTTKFVGQPQYGNDYPNWASCQTPLIFSSKDECCLPNGTYVDHIEIQVWWKATDNPNDPWQFNSSFTIYDNSSDDTNPEIGRIRYPFHFDDDCFHEIWWRGVDIFGNEESWHKQKHKVDCTPPTIIKTVGDPNCEVIANKEYCITNETPITFSAFDEGCMGGVGLKSIQYRIWNTTHGWNEWIYVDGETTIYIDEECTHYLEIKATDFLDNEIVDNETFHVDMQAPEIIKTVGTPLCGPEWQGPDQIPRLYASYFPDGVESYCVTTDTEINLKAIDRGCCTSNITIEYKEWKATDAEPTSWTTYTGNFSFNEECKHFLLVRAYDCLEYGKENPIYWDLEIFYVDDSPPIIDKTVGLPNCEIVPEEEYCVTTYTPITINVSNDGCCQNDIIILRYNINNEEWIYLQEWPTTIFFEEECTHVLTIEATDCLGNVATDVETFHVDDSAPELIKTVGLPNCPLNMDCTMLQIPEEFVTMTVQYLGTYAYFDVELTDVPMGYDIVNGYYRGWCVDQNHTISSNVDYDVELYCSYDPDSPWPDDDWDMVNYLINNKHPDASVMEIQQAIWYFVNGGHIPPTDLGKSMIENATLYGEGFMPTEGEYCAILCDSGDETQKTFIEFKIPENYCVTTETLITLDAIDHPDCCQQDVTIEYKIWLANETIPTTWTTYTQAFSFEEECKHFLLIRAYDCLEHGKDDCHWDLETFYVDDSPPEIIKTVGLPNCEIVPGEEYCVTTDTPITINAENIGCCINDYLGIRYKINDSEWIDLYDWPTTIFFEEECTHVLTIEATDCLGNIATDVETFHVDDSAPELIKTVGLPNCPNEIDCTDLVIPTDPAKMSVYWLGTYAYLDVTLKDVPIGYDIINGDYRGWCVDQQHYISNIDYNVTLYCSYSPDNPWYDDDWDMVNYIINHKHPEATIMDIQEAIWRFVNGGHDPSTAIGMSMVENATLYGEGFMPAEGEYCAILCDAGDEIQKTFIEYRVTEQFCVTTDTLITLDAIDRPDCCQQELTIEYKKWLATDPMPEEWTIYEGPFSFEEECKHFLLVRIYDCLEHGKTGPFWDLEVFYVDEQGPNIIKEVGDPKVKLEDDTYGHDQWMVFPETDICLYVNESTVETGCCPNQDATIEYRVWYLGEWTDWTTYEDCIHLTEGCVHYLEARAVDCLGNVGEVDNETFWVCGPGGSGNSPPQLSFIQPSFGEERCDRTLEVIIDASDSETAKEDLSVVMWIPGGRRDAPTIYYYPEYNPVKYGDNYFHAFIDIYKYQDGTDLTIQAIAQDEDDDIGVTIPHQFIVCSTICYDYWLQDGWNVLDLTHNCIQCSHALEDVLASIDGLYDRIYKYSDVDGWIGWELYRAENGFPNELTTMNQGTYYIHMNGTAARFYIGDALPEIEILSPINGETYFDVEEILGWTKDTETYVETLYLQIYSDQNMYWNGSGWDSTPSNILIISEETMPEINEEGQPINLSGLSGIWMPNTLYTVIATAIDTNGCINTYTISFSISSSAPIANDDSAETNEDTAVDIDVLANDTDSDGNLIPSTVAIVNGPYHGNVTVNTTTGIVTYNPDVEFVGVDYFNYTVEDNDGLVSNIAMVTITISDVNSPPVADSNGPYSTICPDYADIMLDGSGSYDIDGSIVSYEWDLDNDGQFDDVTGMNPLVSFDTPGVFTICLRVTDDDGDFDEDCTTVTVDTCNIAPVAYDDSAVTNEGDAVDIDVLANDTDFDGTLVLSTVNITNGPYHGIIIVNTTTGIVKYQPNIEFVGVDSFNYTVEDNDGLESNIAMVTINVNPILIPPTANNDYAETEMEIPVSIDVLANDSDSDGILINSTINIVDLPYHGIISDINTTTGIITYEPGIGFVGIDSFNYTVEDDGGLVSNVAVVVITVDYYQNQPPVANDDFIDMDEDTSIWFNVLLNDTDPDDEIDPATVEVGTNPSNGTITIAVNGSIKYMPNSDYFGMDSFTYRVKDLYGDYSNYASVEINIHSINDPPTAINDTAEVIEGVPKNIDVLDNDTDPENDFLTISSVSNPSHGTATNNGNDISYVSGPEYLGEDSFTYTISDGNGGTDTATVYITIVAGRGE